MYKFLRNSLVVATLALGVAPSTGLAAPSKMTQCDESVDVYERLACKQAAIAAQMEYTAEVLDSGELSNALSAGQKKQIAHGRDKALRAATKNDDKFFKRLAKAESRGNKGQLGHLVPFDADDDQIPDGGDGICDYEQGVEAADCAAIELDQNGNLQTCNPEKKNKGKGNGDNGNPKFKGLECDRSIDLEEPQGTEEFDDMREAAEQLEATYDAAEDNLIEMNGTLESVNDNVATSASPMQVQTFALAIGSSGCEFPTSTPGLLEAVHSLELVSATLSGAAQIAGHITGQDAFGFNAQAAAAVLDGIAQAADIALIAVQWVADKESDELQGAITDCMDQSQRTLDAVLISMSDAASGTTQQIAGLQGEIGALKGQISDLETTVKGLIAGLQVALIQDNAGKAEDIMSNDNTNSTAIKTNVEAARKEVVDLLRTPEGQRITGN